MENESLQKIAESIKKAFQGDIKAEYKPEDIRNGLRTIPIKVRNASMLINHHRTHVNSLEEQRADIEAEKLLEIQQEVGDNNKPRYSNEAARNAALRESLNKDEGHQELLGTIEAEKSKLAEAIADYELLKHDFKSLTIQAQMFCAELGGVQ